MPSESEDLRRPWPNIARTQEAADTVVYAYGKKKCRQMFKGDEEMLALIELSNTKVSITWSKAKRGRSL